MSVKNRKRSAGIKRIVQLILALAAALALTAGCAKQSETDTADTSADVVSQTPERTPIATTEPINTPVPDPVEEEEEAYMATLHDGWIYYLDTNDPVVVEYSEDPPLHRMLEDESSDEDLDIRGFSFDIIGDYIYLDSNDLDLDETGIQTWGTTRMNLDGTGKKKLEYGSMSARMVMESEQKFYFTTLGDLAVYVSDYSCEKVQTINIKLPDKEEMDEKLGTDNVLQLTINSIGNSLINFDVTVSAENGAILYSGTYKTTIAGTSTEKLSGTYYEYGAQENE